MAQVLKRGGRKPSRSAKKVVPKRPGRYGVFVSPRDSEPTLVSRRDYPRAIAATKVASMNKALVGMEDACGVRPRKVRAYMVEQAPR